MVHQLTLGILSLSLCLSHSGSRLMLSLCCVVLCSFAFWTLTNSYSGCKIRSCSASILEIWERNIVGCTEGALYEARCLCPSQERFTAGSSTVVQNLYYFQYQLT